MANESIQREIGRICEEISKIKDREIELGIGKLNKEISAELYNTEMKLIGKKEEALLSEKEEILAKYNATWELEHREGENRNSRKDTNEHDANEEKQFMRYIRACECKDKNEQAVFCRQCRRFDCSRREMLAQWNNDSEDELRYSDRVRCYECNQSVNAAFIGMHLQHYHNFDKKKDVSFNYPTSWQNMKPNENSEVVDLCKGTREYDRILGLFKQSSSPNFDILGIRQVQNKFLYQQYFARQSNETLKECTLWHLAHIDSVKHINIYGFDRQYTTHYANDNRLIFSLSAEEAVKCAGFQRQMAIYMCDVIIGNYTTETSSKVWPVNTNLRPGGLKFYDSVVDNVVYPKRFKVYSESQVYPAYYILANRNNDVCVLS